MNTLDDFSARKKEILERVVLHLLEPDCYPQPRLSLEDCATFMSKNETKRITRSDACKIERSALLKMRGALERLNIKCTSDILGS